MPNSPWLTHAGLEPPDTVKLEPEYRPHYASWKAAPTPASTSRLLKAVNPVVDTGIKAFGGGQDNPMLRSHAKGLAIAAFKTYDPARAPLKNHLLAHMQGLQRYASRQTRMLSAPDRVVMDKQRVDAGEAELRDVHGRDPSTAELADHISLSKGRIAKVRRYRPGFAEGQIDAMGVGEEGEAGSGPAVEQGDPTAAKVAYLYDDLDPINQAIVEHGFGLHGRPKIRTGEIARRLNLSPSAVSQRAEQIQRMLDELDDTGVLG
jgi:DNA-directed RNA polymerase specialized sigma subunit